MKNILDNNFFQLSSKPTQKGLILKATFFLTIMFFGGMFIPYLTGRFYWVAYFSLFFVILSLFFGFFLELFIFVWRTNQFHKNKDKIEYKGPFWFNVILCGFSIWMLFFGVKLLILLFALLIHG